MAIVEIWVNQYLTDITNTNQYNQYLIKQNWFSVSVK